MKWKVLASEYLHNEPWLTIGKDKCELPGGHVDLSFYLQEYPDWVNAFALPKDNRVVMVKQYATALNDINTTLLYLHTNNKDLLKIVSPLDDLLLS